MTCPRIAQTILPALAAAVLWLCVASVPASATTLVLQSTAKLYEHADLVAVIDVQRITSIQTRGRIVTHVEARVSDTFKGGEVGASLKVLVAGGAVDGLAQRVEGMPTFTEGESCLVFLRQVAPAVYQVVALEQGKLALQRDSAGQWIVRRSVTARMLQPSATGGWEEAAPPETQPAEAFFATLRRLGAGAP